MIDIDTKNVTCLSGKYGDPSNDCTVIVHDNGNGSYWYVVEGSLNINLTVETLADGVDVECISDYDTMTADEAVWNDDDLVRELEDFYEG